MANSYNVVITTTRPSTSVPWAREYAFNYWGELYNESGTRLNSHPGISAGPITIDHDLDGITPFFDYNPDRQGLITQVTISPYATIRTLGPFVANTSVVSAQPAGYTPQIGGHGVINGSFYLGAILPGITFGTDGTGLSNTSTVQNNWYTVANALAVSGWTTNSSGLTTLFINSKLSQANTVDSSGQLWRSLNFQYNVYPQRVGITFTATATPI